MLAKAMEIHETVQFENGGRYFEPKRADQSGDREGEGPY